MAHVTIEGQLEEIEAGFKLLAAMLASIEFDILRRDELDGVTTKQVGLEQVTAWGEFQQPYLTVWTDTETLKVTNYQITMMGKAELARARQELHNIRTKVALVRDWEAAIADQKGGA